ncbi:hypothetical protein D3C72_1988310 [compost metagenome]
MESGGYQWQSVCPHLPAIRHCVRGQYFELCGADGFIFGHQQRCIWRGTYAPRHGGAGERTKSVRQNLAPRNAVGHRAGDDRCAAALGLSELYHAGKCLPGDCVTGDLCDGLGVDHDFAVADCVPPPSAD